MPKSKKYLSPFLCICFLILITPYSQAQETPGPPFKFQEVMIPVRDGVHLQTVILTPTDQQGPLPILFRRTPYGVPASAPTQMPAGIEGTGS